MTGLTAVIKKEFKNLAGSGPSTFIMYAVITFLWSFMMIPGGAMGETWVIFLSVVVGAGLSSTVFISERVNGTLEVVLTSGLSRDAVLFGKMIFVIAMTSAIGLACGCLGMIWAASDALGLGIIEGRLRSFAVYAAALYLSVTLFNAAAAAYLSVRMANPRLLHLIILFMTGGIAAMHSAMTAFHYSDPVVLISLVLTFLLAGTIFIFLARREFAGERITRPVIF